MKETVLVLLKNFELNLLNSNLIYRLVSEMADSFTCFWYLTISVYHPESNFITSSFKVKVLLLIYVRINPQLVTSFLILLLIWKLFMDKESKTASRSRHMLCFSQKWHENIYINKQLLPNPDTLHLNRFLSPVLPLTLSPSQGFVSLSSAK